MLKKSLARCLISVKVVTRSFEVFSLMFWRLGITLALIAQFLCPAVASAAFDQKHSLWSAELKKYADGPLIHYGKWKDHQAGLDAYIKSLGSVTAAEYQKFSTNEKKAFWVNAYNAFAIKIVLDHYPIHGTKSYYPQGSLRQIPNVWDDFAYDAAGQKVTLYYIAHNIIRHDFADPRLHFAIVCASKGCPDMKPSAYIGETLDKDLDAAARAYVSNSRNIQYDAQNHVLKVSQLFKWFPLDFAAPAGFTKIGFPPPTDDAIVVAYVSTVASPELKKQLTGPDSKNIKVVYLPYDWSLNDADETQSTAKKSMIDGGTYGAYQSLPAFICGCHSPGSAAPGS